MANCWPRGGDDGQIKIWNRTTGASTTAIQAHDVRRINGQYGLIRALAWSPDGTKLASGGLDGAARIWDVASGAQILELPASHGAVWSVTWSPDGTQLAFGSQDGTIRVLDGLSQSPRVHAFPAHQGNVRSLAWSPQGNRLASGGGNDLLVKLWDPARGAELARMEGHSDSVMGVAWSRDGKRLATASGDRLVISWNANSGTRLSTMSGHNDFVDQVVWSPDGTRLASAGLDNTVRIWDPANGEETFVLRGDSGMFHDVSWNTDGAQLSAASSDGQIWIWDATPGFVRDTTPRAVPYIDQQVALGNHRGEQLRWYVESYIRAGKHQEALDLLRDDLQNLSWGARLLDEQGKFDLAAQARDTIRRRLEQRLPTEPENEQLLSELADLLLAQSSARWQILETIEMSSRGGANLTRQPDGSILASGPNAPGDTYTISAVADLDRISAIRLEALPDPSLPMVALAGTIREIFNSVHFAWQSPRQTVPSDGLPFPSSLPGPASITKPGMPMSWGQLTRA